MPFSSRVFDDDALLRLAVEENGAVLLEGGDGNDARLKHAHGVLAQSAALRLI